MRKCSYRSRAYKRRCSRPEQKDYVIQMLKVCFEKRCAVLITFLTGVLNADPDPGDKIVLLLWINVNWKICKNFVSGWLPVSDGEKNNKKSKDDFAFSCGIQAFRIWIRI